jgi:bis(5'-nucleosyl)-tetraphosphatase (symmetrical)
VDPTCYEPAVDRLQRIFVGDVQGCADEFDEVLARARAAFGDRFELWVVGDLVNRGPDNLRPLERVRDLAERGRAHYVLGNHELALLRTAAGVRRPSPLDSFGDVLGSSEADGWIDWLRRLPIARSGRLGAQPFVMTHAAVDPDWDLAEVERRARRVESRLAHPDRAEAFAFLDPRGDRSNRKGARSRDRDALALFTSCRSVSPAGDWSSEPPESRSDRRAWHAIWTERDHGYGVVYGHWSLQGLHVAPWLRGLDTGCVHNGRGRATSLTAWLPDPTAETPFDVPDDRFWQVPARRAYYAHRDRPAG